MVNRLLIVMRTSLTREARLRRGRKSVACCYKENSMGIILLIVIVLLLVGGLPTWGYSKKWGYGPSGALGTVLVILLILVLLGYIPSRF